MALDIYIAVVSSAHSVCPKGYYIAIVSTIAETTANHHLELAPGFERLGKIEEKFMVSSSTCVSLPDQLTFSGSPNSIVRAA
jgi:RAB protein geranylgeranyltransferase component A